MNGLHLQLFDPTNAGPHYWHTFCRYDYFGAGDETGIRKKVVTFPQGQTCGNAGPKTEKNWDGQKPQGIGSG